MIGCVPTDGFRNESIRNELGVKSLLEEIRTYSECRRDNRIRMLKIDCLNKQCCTRHTEEELLKYQRRDRRICETGRGWVLNPESEEDEKEHITKLVFLDIYKKKH